MSDLNDPRVLFAAERTLLAWNRTSLSLMAFGFMVDRFGLFLQIAGKEEIKLFQRHISFYIGELFIMVGSAVAIYSVLQHRRILKTLRPIEIPTGYNLNAGLILNLFLAVLGFAVTFYLGRGFM